MLSDETVVCRICQLCLSLIASFSLHYEAHRSLSFPYIPRKARNSSTREPRTAEVEQANLELSASILLIRSNSDDEDPFSFSAWTTSNFVVTTALSIFRSTKIIPIILENRRDGRVVNAVYASRAEVHSHVDAVSSGRSRVRFPRLAGRLLQGRFLWFPFFSGECRSRYQAIAYRSLIPKLPQHRPVGPSRRAREREIQKNGRRFQRTE